MNSGEKIAKNAFSWIGTPHINGAKVKGKGVDCGMLLIGCLEDSELLKKNELYIEPYSNEWHLHHSDEWFKNYVEQCCREVPYSDLQVGDFLLYQFGRCCSHGAVYIGDNTVIHSVVDEGVIMSTLDDSMFIDRQGKPRLRHVYRFEGLK